MDAKTIQEILNTDQGKSLIKHLAESILAMDTLDGINLDDPVEATVELKARKLAINKLRDILGSLIVSTNPSRIKDDRDSFGVDIISK